MKKVSLLLLCLLPMLSAVQGQTDNPSAGTERVVIWCDGVAETPSPSAYADYSKESVYTLVEEMPSYVGGEEARLKFLKKTFKYPTLALEQSIQGTIQLTFVITKTGCISKVRVLSGIGGGCDEEAIRVVQQMPRWNPGKNDGVPVAVQYKMTLLVNMNP